MLILSHSLNPWTSTMDLKGSMQPGYDPRPWKPANYYYTIPSETFWYKTICSHFILYMHGLSKVTLQMYTLMNVEGM